MRFISSNKYNSIVVLTGAGISAGSGLRTFRGPNGLWSDPETAKLSSANGFKNEPALCWQFWSEMRTAAENATPNEAHQALALWEQNLQPNQSFTLITQNIDGLHQRAGSKNVVELHGSLFLTSCCNEQCELTPFQYQDQPEKSIPKCPLCAHNLRPSIVLFEEPIPAYAEWQAKRAFRECDLYIAIGTSGTVAPASRFVEWAKYAQAETVFINLEEPSRTNKHFDRQFIGPAELLLPQLLQ